MHVIFGILNGMNFSFCFNIMKAEGQIKNYAFICTLVQQVKDGQMIKTLANKLIFRVYVNATVLWKACISRPHGIFQLVDQDDINSFVYYCHLLEVLMAASPSDCRLEVQVFEFSLLLLMKFSVCICIKTL